jgi:hypothetical protein
MEIWRDIKFYEWLYQISDLARIKSLWTGKSNNSKPIIMKIGKRRQYWKIMLYNNWIGKEFSVHRLVWQAFLWLDINNPKQLCLHKYEELDSRWMLNNSKDNLFLGTHKDNSQDMLSKWRHKPAWKWKFWKEHNITNTIKQYTINWGFIKNWNWGYEIQRELWFYPSNINKVCNWKRKTAYWFIWRFG